MPSVRIAIASVALPVALAAQQPAVPQANPITTLPDAIAFTLGGIERKSTRVNVVLLHALDLADHYSQIANYMRLNGMLPPSALPRR